MIERVIVWIPSEKCYGEIIRELAHVSLVRFMKDGVDFEVYMSDEDFDVFGTRRIIGYEVEE